MFQFLEIVNCGTSKCLIKTCCIQGDVSHGNRKSSNALKLHLSVEENRGI